MPRELALALNAKVTWLVLAVSALLVGHGFVLAVDIFSAESRSALSNLLMTRESDPLAGVVRPTLGALQLAVSLMVPLIAVRGLAVEKEHRNFGPLALRVGSISKVVAAKWGAALAASAFLVAPPVVLFVAYRAVGGHVDAIETGTALAGHVLHLVVLVSAATAAAAWTSTVAQAATVGILVSLASWAVDAGEGFAALAWLGGAERWSIERHFGLFDQGVVAVGPALWLVAAALGGLGAALVGARFDWGTQRRLAGASVTFVFVGALLLASDHLHRRYDWSEERRASLPPDVATSLADIAGPIRLEIFLDRDDSRRRQLEGDVLAKLALARPDLEIETPLDHPASPSQPGRDLGYGRIVIHVGDGTRETRSTSRREIVTLIFEAAARPLPAWSQPPYPGYPVVVEGARRTVLVAVAYGVLPGAFLVVGWLRTRRGRRRR
ncbi:MAG TPA: hypothetical protein VF316_20920 [Polyangiaceae bacterium]